MTENLCYTPASELALRIRQGELSPVEVVEAFLDRIEDHNDETNAYVHVLDERARKAAHEAERAVTSGDRLGPLHGVPVAVKDFEDVAGVPNTKGSKPLADVVPEENAVFVDRLLDAGAIVLGKTNTPEFMHKGTTDNLLFGPTSTPFDLSKNAGGSSGGSTAAIADGLAPIAQGSDGGGSLRIPASLCGVYGIKPTYRRLPRPATPDTFTHTPYSHLGPQARTVEDAALILEVMHGPHPDDPMVAPDDGIDYLGATRRSIAGFDVAYSPTLGGFPVDNRVRAIVAEAVDTFEAVGATVHETEPNFGYEHGGLAEWWLRAVAVKYAVLADVLQEEHGVDCTGAHREEITPEIVELIEYGREQSAREYKASDSVRTDVFLEIQRLLGEHDLLVTPTLAVPSVDNDNENTLGPSEVNGEAVNPLIGWCLTFPFNMSGHPAANVPAGLTGDGLPIGMQIVGHRFADADVIAASAAFERARPWDHMYPPR